MLIKIKNIVVGLNANDIFFILVFDGAGVVVVYLRSVIPKSINAATESGSKTPSAKKLNPKYPAI